MIIIGHGTEPKRADYPSWYAWTEALYRWRDAVTEEANAAFDAAFRKAMKEEA